MPVLSTKGEGRIRNNTGICPPPDVEGDGWCTSVRLTLVRSMEVMD